MTHTQQQQQIHAQFTLPPSLPTLIRDNMLTFFQDVFFFDPSLLMFLSILDLSDTAAPKPTAHTIYTPAQIHLSTQTSTPIASIF
jgi:hypothetical protein